MGFEEKNIVCEPCDPKLYAAFDIDKKEVSFLNIYNLKS